MIISLLSFSVYRFVSSNLRAMKATSEIHDERESIQGVIRFVQMQLAELPRRQNSAILGNPLKLKNLPSDELIWITNAGQGVLTGGAPGQYRVTLTVQPVDTTSSQLELGLRREPFTDEARSNMDFYTRGSGVNKYNWVPLLKMAAFEVRYFDSRLNAWLDRWTDPGARPQLVRIRLWQDPMQPPVEAILPVPSALMQAP